MKSLPSPFYGMIARTKSYVFTEIFLAVFPLGPPFWPAQLMFWLIWFSKQKSSSSKRRFHWGILRGIFSVKTARAWRHPFVWILLHCNFFVICYYLFPFSSHSFFWGDKQVSYKICVLVNTLSICKFRIVLFADRRFHDFHESFHSTKV